MNKKNLRRNLKDKRIRVSIMLDKINSQKLRTIQAKIIKESSTHISFSHIINQIIKVGLKHFKKEEKDQS